MIGELALVAWLCLAAYTIWFLALAKDYVPLTDIETTFLWRLHKIKSHCSSTKFEKIRRKKKAVGFRCGCGHEYLSKRLITQHDLRAGVLNACTSQEEPVYLERYE